MIVSCYFLIKVDKFKISNSEGVSMLTDAIATIAVIAAIFVSTFNFM